MKRIVFVILLSACLFIFFAVTASAEESESDKILGEFSEILPEDGGVDPDGDFMDEVSFGSIFEDILSAFAGRWGEVTSFFLMLMGFAVIMAICEGAYVSDNPTLRKNSSVAVAAIASVSIFSSLYEVVGSVRESLGSVTDFLSSLLPIMTAINATSGAPTVASVQAASINVTLALLEKLATGVLLPLVFTLFSLALVSSFSDGGIASVARGIKSVFMWGIGIICTALAAAIGLQSLVASAADTAALRAARYAASGTIPIVGTTVASAIATLAGGLAFVRSNVGVASVAVLISLAVLPIVSLLLYRLAFSAAIIFLEFVGSEGGVRCFSAFRSALDALLAIYSVSVLICIIQIVVFLKSGVSVE